MFKNACFFLFCGYIARYAPLKNKKNILFLLYKKIWRYNFKQLLKIVFAKIIKRVG